MTRNPNEAIAATLYQPLQNDRTGDTAQEIRLLAIDAIPDNRRVPGNLISCTLRTCSVAVARQIGYYALSYVWGDASDTCPILVNGLIFAATRNLVEALIHVSEVEPRCGSGLWVDAICINQMDVAEKNVQVALMSRIYTGATETLAWLGAGDPASNAAMHLVNWLWNDHELLGVGKNQPQLEKLGDPRLLQLVEEAGGDLIGAEVFVARTYWTRIWTIQEALLPEKCRLIAGKESCFLNSLVEIMEWAFTEPLLEFTASDLPEDFSIVMRRAQDMIRKIQFRSEDGVPLPQLRTIKNVAFRVGVRQKFPDIERTMDCVRYAQSRDATDPRDKLFGFSALVNIGVEIAYDMSTRDLYIAFATRLILHLEDVRALLICAGFSGQSSALELPSWVPDWRIPYPGVVVYGGDLDIRELKLLRPVVLGEALRVGGVCLGVIESTSQPGLIPGAASSGEGDGRESVEERCRRVSRIAEYLMGCDVTRIVDEILPETPSKNRYMDEMPLVVAVLGLLAPKSMRSTRYRDTPTGDVVSLIHAFFVSGGISLLPTEGDVAGIPGRYLGPHVLSTVCDNGRTEALDRNDILREAAHHFQGPAFFNSLLGDGYEAGLGLSEYVYFRTTNGYLGYTARSIQAGDTVYMMGSCVGLVVLRPVDAHFVYLSTCHIEGFGSDDVVRWADFEGKIEDIEIK